MPKKPDTIEHFDNMIIQGFL